MQIGYPRNDFIERLEQLVLFVLFCLFVTAPAIFLHVRFKISAFLKLNNSSRMNNLRIPINTTWLPVAVLRVPSVPCPPQGGSTRV